MLIKTHTPPSQALTKEQVEALPEINLGEMNASKFEWVDGAGVYYPPVSGKCFPLEQQKLYAEFLLQELNNELHHDGKWRIVFADPVKSKYDPAGGLFRSYVPQKIECQFLDQDDDPQFVVGLEQTIEELVEWGLNPVLDMCEHAWKEWEQFMSLVGVTPDEMICAAKGEKSKDESLEYVID